MQKILQNLQKIFGGLILAFQKWNGLLLSFWTRVVLRKEAPVQDSVSLKKKTVYCSAEAAAISIGIHLLLAFFAGSWIIFQHVQKMNAEFSGENLNRPKLERRQLQMPVKVQNLQKKSQRPKVTSRMASVSKTSFALPDMSGLGGAGKVGLGRDGVATERDLSAMSAAGSLGFGVSGVNFFGARSKGEKLVFIIDASQEMMIDSKGGYNTYKFAKDKIHAMINGLRSATLFNVIVYADQTAKSPVIFRPQLVPGTPENRASIKKWLDPLNANSSSVGTLKEMDPLYTSQIRYDTLMDGDVVSALLAIQAAMEQGADNIFILCAGAGRTRIGPLGLERLGKGSVDEAKWLLEQGWPPERVAAAEKAQAEFNAKVDAELAKENKARADKGLPPRILSWGDRWKYITEELHWTPPASRPRYNAGTTIGRYDYDWTEISDYLKTVCETNYVAKGLNKPQIHFVRLIAEDDTLSAGDADSVKIKKITSEYRGKYEFLRGAKTMENLLKNNDLAPE